MPVAANIDEVIEYASTDIAEVAYGGVDSVYDQMELWIEGMFGAAGIFPPSANETESGQRAVTNWYVTSLQALDRIAVDVGQDSLYGTCDTINAVVRSAYAVKQAATAGGITGAQQTAVVTLYNNVWA